MASSSIVLVSLTGDEQIRLYDLDQASEHCSFARPATPMDRRARSACTLPEACF